VRDQLGGAVDYIVDGGRTTVGVESTVLDLSGERPRILRPGGCSRESIEALIGPVETGGEGGGGNQHHSPGQLTSHYAPRTPLILHASGDLAAVPPRDGEGRLYYAPPGAVCRGVFFGVAGTAGETGSVMINPDASHLASMANGSSSVRFLSETGSVTEAAANLFDILHEMDGLGLRLIHAEEAPPGGLGAAINDRLQRAANR
jgi:L-threonylcarbamoyladenylate synthase